MRPPERRRDGLELRAALVDRHARAEPRDRPQEQVGPIFVIARLEGEERPELRVAIREVKARRHHADDDVRGLVERDGASEDVGVGAEDALPERLAQNEWPRAAGVGGQERPAEHGVHAERLEEVRGREDALEPLRLTRPGEVHRRAREGGHARERRSPLLPVPEIARRDLDPRVAALRLVLPDAHQAIGLGKRQRPDQHVVGDREHRGRGADAERRDGQRRRGEGTRAAERAERVAQVVAQQVHVHARGVAKRLRDRDRPEREDGSEPCGIAPLPREDRGHLRAVLVAERAREQMEQEAVDSHQAFPVSRPLARASRTSAVSRDASARAAARPAGVRR